MGTREKIMSIVNVFETGKPEGDYGAVVVYADGKNGSKQITYGRSQTTEQGNLKNLIAQYISMSGIYAAQLSPYSGKIGRTPLFNDSTFKELLRKAGKEDPIMKSAQDDMFARLYFEPAVHFFSAEGFTLPLSLLVIYDSFIHSGGIPAFLRSRFPARTPRYGGLEKEWIIQYVKVRQDWLATHSNKVLHPTVYRTKTFLSEVTKDNWDLSKPVKAQGVIIE